jgi:hypothetical protein
MIKTHFLVPVRDNAGRPHSRGLWLELEQRLITLFGGYSRVTGIHGAWEYEGRIYRDISRGYSVSLERWTLLPVWLDLVRWARQAFQQEAIYIEVAGVPEIIGPD